MDPSLQQWMCPDKQILWLLNILNHVALQLE